eukprot:CAMPEP_0170790836 /NCGR_PEP_ID=MMETSP0733-20121128/20740_1 /TAXON_ID=186038 /ORGANISM="Fragilariopsis kerguelensis, Strain L26-C5" /LENGTH=30 /DNA_ID= /DNA_START= /DNA_END= /DNA_ORIENTATION=
MDACPMRSCESGGDDDCARAICMNYSTLVW